MELLEAMERRHSVRSYEDRPLEPEVRAELTEFLDQCSRESGLHMQLVLAEPEAFGGLMAHYGKFSGVKNYIALVGKKSAQLDELCGYFGEKVVLKAQQMGLNTCWVALTYKKVQEIVEIFKQTNHSVICKELLGLSGSAPTPPVPQERTEIYYKKRPCVQIVEDAAKAAEAVLFPEEQE